MKIKKINDTFFAEAVDRIECVVSTFLNIYGSKYWNTEKEFEHVQRIVWHIQSHPINQVSFGALLEKIIKNMSVLVDNKKEVYSFYGTISQLQQALNNNLKKDFQRIWNIFVKMSSRPEIDKKNIGNVSGISKKEIIRLMKEIQDIGDFGKAKIKNGVVVGDGSEYDFILDIPGDFFRWELEEDEDCIEAFNVLTKLK